MTKRTDGPGGWKLDGRPVSSDDVALALVEGDAEWTIFVDGAKFREELGVDGVLTAMRDIAESPTRATLLEYYCTVLGLLAPWFAITAAMRDIIGLGWQLAALVGVVVGVALVQRRVGIGLLD